MSRQETNNDETYYNIGKKYGFKNLVIIGKGGFGCIMLGTKEGDGKVYAIKICIPDPVRIIKLRKEMVDQFRGRNIIKIFYHNLKDDEEYYYIIIMELSYIGDLKHFGNKLYNDLIFKEPFEEKVGDNLVRYFTQQMVTALTTLYQGNLEHYDIKPDNILIFSGLEFKLIDFSLLRKLNPKVTAPIAGGTPGYMTPEYYKFSRQDLKFEILQKQDYFALGIVIFMMKYLLEYSPIPLTREGTDENNLSITIDSIQRVINKIKSQITQSEDFNEFLINMVQIAPEDRFDFEKIIRNKWLNKNTKEIKKIKDINNSDEDCLKLELQKSDFLNNNRKYYRKGFDEKYNDDKKNYRYVRKGKFKFGKRN